MSITTYKKLTPNPLGLGMGVTVTDETFTDEDFDDVNRKKLKGALRVGLVEVIDAKAKAKNTAVNADGAVQRLEAELERVTAERDKALDELSKLKEGDEDAWITMSKEELAEAYTIPELRKLIKDEFPDYELGRGLKEAELTKIIVDLVAEANAEFDANLNDANTGSEA